MAYHLREVGYMCGFVRLDDLRRQTLLPNFCCSANGVQRRMCAINHTVLLVIGLKTMPAFGFSLLLFGMHGIHFSAVSTVSKPVESNKCSPSRCPVGIVFWWVKGVCKRKCCTSPVFFVVMFVSRSSHGSEKRLLLVVQNIIENQSSVLI